MEVNELHTDTTRYVDELASWLEAELKAIDSDNRSSGAEAASEAEAANEATEAVHRPWQTHGPASAESCLLATSRLCACSPLPKCFDECPLQARMLQLPGDNA